MKKLIICSLVISSIIACKRQMEKRFPTGFYKIFLINQSYIKLDNTYTLADSTIFVKLISSENDLITLKQYAIDAEYDTTYSSNNSELYIEKKKNVIGTIKTSWELPILLHDGVIEEHNKNNFLISGKAQYHFLSIVDGYSKSVDVTADFVFKKQ